MEYLSKPEVMEYLEGYRKNIVLRGDSCDDITEIIHYINGLYTHRPTLQAQWIRKKDSIVCSRCGFLTLIYKNTKYCPNCGKMMVNGKAYDSK